MVRDDDRMESRSTKFGRVDPFCWLLVVPLLVVAILLAILSPLVGGGIAFGTLVILVFDSWSNRPTPATPEHWSSERRSPASGRDQRFADSFARSR